MHFYVKLLNFLPQSNSATPAPSPPSPLASPPVMEGILTVGVKEWLIWTVLAMVSAALMAVSMFARQRDRQTDRHTEG